jgi:predicted nucleic acid-binding protein
VTGWLLDSNILCELRRPKPNPKVVAFVASKSLDLLFVSIVTFAEIRFGIERVSNATHRAELSQGLTRKVRPMFEQRALPVSEDVMFKWRLLGEDGRKACPRAARSADPWAGCLLTTRSHYRRDGAAPRPDGRLARHQRLQQGPCPGSQSVARCRCRIGFDYGKFIPFG